MSKRAVFFHTTEFCFDLQKCLSPTPTVSNEVIEARTLNGNTYPSLRKAVEGELKNMVTDVVNTLTFVGKVLTTSELNADYIGATGDYFYCIGDGLYYAWTGTEWIVCGDASKLADGSVTPEKTSFISGEYYPNLLNDSIPISLGKLLNNSGWTESNAEYDTLQNGIPVEAGKTYCFSKNDKLQYVYKVMFKSADDLPYYASGTLISVKIGVNGTITAPEGAKYMFLSNYHSDEERGGFTGLVVQQSTTPKPLSANGYVLNELIQAPQYIKSNLYNLTMMTLGDSLSEGGHWQEYVQKYTGLKNVKNLAIGGTKINVFADNVTEQNIADVDVVFVMGLFNSSSSPAGTVEDLPSNEENASVCACYKYVVEKLYALKPSVKIVLASPHRPQANDVAEKAKAVGMVAAYYGIPFIDLYNTAGFNDYTYSLYLRDSVHSSYGEGGGYEQEAKVIAGGLLKYFG